MIFTKTNRPTYGFAGLLMLRLKLHYPRNLRRILPIKSLR